jgi:two-component system chemotaxis sensor kinase CheA
MDMSQYLEIFIDESKEHLQLLNQSLLSLEQDPQDRAVLDEIFRVAHTLKWQSLPTIWRMSCMPLEIVR